MVCPSCSSNIPDDAGFCAFCGEAIRRCAQCGTSYAEDAQFCGHCGSDLTDEGSARAPVDTGRQRANESNSIFDTAPGRPGSAAGDERPTFILPSHSERRDPNVFGYLYRPSDPSERYELRRGDNTLGAGHNNDIVVDEPAISWNHALLICRNQKVFVQDSASTNGTYVDGERITRPHRLEHEATVRFGNVAFEVWLDDSYR
ncbi:MAG: FHA domain-containing protein [Persicimonas sp.]